MEQWKETWYAQNPDKGEFALNIALGDKYNIWDASANHPLNAAAKEEIRLDLFSHFSGRKKSSLSAQIRSATTRAGDSHASSDIPVKTSDPER